MLAQRSDFPEPSVISPRARVGAADQIGAAMEIEVFRTPE
jgi:hypothetical protein